MATIKRYGSINIDVDTLESDLPGPGGRMRRGVDAVEMAELSYSKFLPRFLDACDRHDVKATFFIIGKHALSKKNRSIIRRIADDGHEIANHTMNHLKQFSQLSERRIEEEIAEAEKILTDVTGKPMSGFRAPGYVFNETVVSVLEKRGYLYDSSLLPSILYNAVKLFYKRFLCSRDNADFFAVQDVRSCFATPRPFRPGRKMKRKTNIDGSLLEIPVNVVPFIRLPFVSSIIAPLGFNRIASLYRFLKKSDQFLNYQLHDNEFVDITDLSERGFSENTFYITGRHLKKTLDDRASDMEKLLLLFLADYTIVRLEDLARKILHGENPSC